MGFVRDLTGKTAANRAGQAGDIQSQAALDASQLQVQAGRDASALLDPFAGIGQQGLEQSNFLTDPQAQFDFLQNNPLFQMGLDNANQQTLGLAASRGRLSAGDTLQQLTNNSLLAAQPLINDQKNSIGNLLNFGSTTAANQGNLLLGQGTAAAGGITNSAAAQAAGMVGEANARGQAAQNIFDIGGKVAGFFSDPKLKSNIEIVGVENGFNIYSWVWNELANKIGLFGESKGVMADQVKQVRPEAVSVINGYMHVNYSMIGVSV